MDPRETTKDTQMRPAVVITHNTGSTSDLAMKAFKALQRAGKTAEARNLLSEVSAKPFETAEIVKKYVEVKDERN